MSDGKKARKISLIIAGLVIGILLLSVTVAVLINSDKQYQKQVQNNRSVELEEATADTLQSILDVYYANYNAYPVSYETLTSDVKAHPKAYGKDAQAVYHELTDVIPQTLKKLDYSTRGDNRAYLFTYTNSVTNSSVTVKGEYEKDFH